MVNFLYEMAVYAAMCIPFAVLGGLTVWGSIKFNREPDAIRPPNYDNRWPGFPLRLGDEKFNPDIKAAWGGHPAELRYDGRWFVA